MAASSHPWAELEALVDDPQLRVLAAHERVLRGEAIDPSLGDRMLVDAPRGLASWEPEYPTAVYRSDGVADPEIDLPPMSWSELPDLGHERRTDNGSQALVDLVQPWIEDSNGRGEAIVVEGSALDAIRTLGPRRVLLAELTFGQALAVMTWTGASGGAHGRRRGTPVGRALSWWALASLVGLDDDWPVDADELGEAASELRWWRWDPGEDIGGWAFNLAVEDPVDGLAWAVSAADAV